MVAENKSFSASEIFIRAENINFSDSETIVSTENNSFRCTETFIFRDHFGANYIYCVRVSEISTEINSETKKFIISFRFTEIKNFRLSFCSAENNT